MSHGMTFLHSHSGLERELKLPKHTVLIDTCFGGMFHKDGIKTEPFKYNGVNYFKVNTLAFVNAGGIFKNLSA